MGAGAFVGAGLRYFVASWAAERWGSAFPYGTLIINVSGAFVIGCSCRPSRPERAWGRCSGCWW
ncbi:MAG TPA: CrcB family protein [Chloroflexota bacterium]